MTKLIVAFRYFAHASNNRLSELTKTVQF